MFFVESYLQINLQYLAPFPRYGGLGLLVQLST